MALKMLAILFIAWLCSTEANIVGDEVCVEEACKKAAGTDSGRYLMANFHYRSGMSDQRELWFRFALLLAESLGRILVLPKFWVPDVDSHSYSKAHFEPFEGLYDPRSFEARHPSISYEMFRQVSGGKLEQVFTLSHVADRFHNAACGNGGTVEFFGDIWAYSELSCFERNSAGKHQLMRTLVSDEKTIIAIDTDNNQDLPNYGVRKRSILACWLRWPILISYNPMLHDAAQTYIRNTFKGAPYLAIHWRWKSSMHKSVPEVVEIIHDVLEQQGETLDIARIFLASNCESESDMQELRSSVGLPIVRFTDGTFHPWQRALVDQIISSEAPIFTPTHMSSTFTKVILHSRAGKGKSVDPEARIWC